MSEIPPPTLPPPERNQPTPSDYLAGDTIGGRVTKGGAGPCNEIVNDDGKVYSLHNPAGLMLEEGRYVTAKVAPLRARIYCGPGQQLELVSFTNQ